MEKLNFNKNGQWTIKKNWTPEDKENIIGWQDGHNREDLEKVPPATGKLRESMMQALGSSTESRINPDTGNKEYLLYRGAGKGSTFHEKRISSWTTDLNRAHHFAWLLQDMGLPGVQGTSQEPRKGEIMHAWIPEKHIHSALIGEHDPIGYGESEVIVNPTKEIIPHVRERVNKKRVREIESVA